MVAYSQAANGSIHSNTLEKEALRLFYAFDACYGKESMRFNGGNQLVSQYYEGKDDDGNPVVQFQVLINLAPGYSANRTAPTWSSAIERKDILFPIAYNEAT